MVYRLYRESKIQYFFQSPQPPDSWENERDATASDVINTSCQLNFKTGEYVGSEDCLYLNVYTPKLPSPSTKMLPVMVFIHGGAFIYGSGIIKTDVGPDFIVENDVVVVAINYRLGVFGFLSLDIPEAAGNMGLKDQVKALEWIQKNIEIFGGDKDNVTIFGISAGSASVEYLVLSPSAKGLFHKAILQSGSSLNDWAINYKYKELTSNFVKKLGYKGDTEDSLAVYQFLLRAPAPLLTATAFQVTETFTAKSIFFGFVPIVEKDSNSDAIITVHPYKLLKEGRFNKVPILRGFCGKEGTLMNMMKPFAVKELLENRNFVSYWSFDLEGDKEKYNTTFCDIYQKTPQDEDSEKFAADFFGDLHFSAGIWLAAKLQASCGVPTHFYQFVYDGKLNSAKVLFGLMKKGAGHGDDMFYLFTNDNIHVQPDETDILVRQRMSKMWTNFAKTRYVSLSC